MDSSPTHAIDVSLGWKGRSRARLSPRLVADSALAKKLLDWKPRHAALEAILARAWRWEQQQR